MKIIQVLPELRKRRYTWLKAMRRVHDLRDWLADHAAELNNSRFDEMRAEFHQALIHEDEAWNKLVNIIRISELTAKEQQLLTTKITES